MIIHRLKCEQENYRNTTGTEKMKQACINSPDKRTVVIAVNINIIRQYDEKK